MITQQEFEAALESKKKADEVITQFIREQNDAADARLQKLDENPLTDDELVYAERALCPCGHGLAHPKKTGWNFRVWDCSAIWKGIADKKVKHTGQLPFAFYDVKAEGERPGGGTTRGVFKPKPVEG